MFGWSMILSLRMGVTKLTHPLVARVAVLTASATLWSAVSRWLSDASTTVLRVADLTGVETMEHPDVVVIDRDLLRDPDRGLRRLRKRWLTATIIIVGTRDDADAVRLLDAGADDAVSAGSPQLESRLHALTRRARTVNAGARIAVGDILFDRESRRVWCAGKEVELTRTEEAFLDCLFWHSPQVVGVTTLTDFVWGDDVTPERRSLVRVYMGYLRTKLSASRQVVIRAVRGVGYGFAERSAASSEDGRVEES
jgi:DNA-binding response OmpR family regulator